MLFLQHINKNVRNVVISTIPESFRSEAYSDFRGNYSGSLITITGEKLTTESEGSHLPFRDYI